MSALRYAFLAVALIPLALPLISKGADANGLYFQGGHQYGGGGIYYQQDLSRIERNYRNLNQRSIQELERCRSDLDRQQRTYMEALSRQQGLGARIDELRTNNETLSRAAGTQEGTAQGPSQQTYDDLQERYDTLLAAYRNLQRDHRSLTERP